MHRSTSRTLLAATTATTAVLMAASMGLAKVTPEQQCQKGRYGAAAKYAQCQYNAFGAFFAGGDFMTFQAALSKCRGKYTSTWATLEKKAAGTGSTCDSARLINNIDGTVTDKLTGLQWEKKTLLGVNVTYAWPASMIVDLINSGNLGGQADWRLPTPAELLTIVSEPYPCTTSPCIDPVFGPTGTGNYWSSRQVATDPTLAWFVNFTAGGVDNSGVSGTFFARAVRGGL
jgi:hypothetical protein